MPNIISEFIFYYPIFMAYAWIIGGLIYYWRWERSDGDVSQDMPRYQQPPPISILIPCHNEAANIRETIEFLLQQKYPYYEIIAINDGSTDNTLEILIRLSAQYEKVRVVNLTSNQGKAAALKAGAIVAKNEFLLCIDGDALLAPEACSWIMRHFIKYPKVAAVTGNPRIRTRSTLIGKIQVGEFSAIVGMIKRSQRVYGRVFSVSGVIAAFRKRALHEVGYWSTDMVTEDIDITWKLQLAGWQIRFEQNALCWVLMPETLKGLWRQRLRWAQGGAEVLVRHFNQLMQLKNWQMWPIFGECLISIAWAYLISLAAATWLVQEITRLFGNQFTLFDPSWSAMFLGISCMVQFAVSMLIDARYEKSSGGTGRYYYWMVWYPLVYWLINVGTSVVGTIKALMKKSGQRAVWVTLDRGIR